MQIREIIELIDQQQKEQDAIYHNVAVRFGLSDTAMWVLYLVSCDDKIHTQQELCQTRFFPKQTINTAITKLVQKGYATLKPLPNTKNKKQILLTQQGTEFVKQTVNKLVEAETVAYEQISTEELLAYLELSKRINANLREQTDKIFNIKEDNHG